MLKPRGGRAIAGARLARSVSAAIIAIYGVRVGGTRLGHDFSFANCWAGYAVLVRILMFLSISLNFGFLLMAMDSEVADLPLQNDLRRRQPPTSGATPEGGVRAVTVERRTVRTARDQPRRF